MNRSSVMRAVKSRDTGPEMKVRRLVHRLGFRYRLYRKDLPGKPDLVFPSKRRVILVHGCFWHGHECARGSRVPVGNREYWIEKIRRNKARDATVVINLRDHGWSPLIIWECELRNVADLEKRIRKFLA